MLGTIRDDTRNVLNMQHITPNSKIWDYSDIPYGGTDRLKDLSTWLKVTTTLEKDPNPHPLEISIFANIVKYYNNRNTKANSQWQ